MTKARLDYEKTDAKCEVAIIMPAPKCIRNE